MNEGDSEGKRRLMGVDYRGSGADPGFFRRGGCKYESSRQTSRGQWNGGGGSWRVMFEYIDFRHFDFKGINLSNLRHYY